jgi:Fe-S oxidoreductase
MTEHIRREGLVYTIPVLRNAVLGGLGIKSKKRTAENAVVIGCGCYGTLDAVHSAFRLLDMLGIDYALIAKEYCCGAPLIAGQVKNSKDRTKADLAATEFLGLNIDQAREMGAKRIMYMCLWCTYLARYFHSECGLEHFYYFDILDEPISQASLTMKEPTTVAYFQGGQHRSWVYIPKRDWDLNWPLYRDLLEKIGNLRVVDIPKKYCCVLAHKSIFDRVEKEGIGILITSCISCYGRLQRTAPAGIEVKFLSDILLEALDNS